MDETLALRPAVPDDEAFLFRVYASTRTEELAPVHGAPRKKKVLDWQAARALLLCGELPGAEFQVILLGGQPSADFIYIVDRWKSASWISPGARISLSRLWNGDAQQVMVVGQRTGAAG
jgi:hypothetical protein